MVNLTKKFAKFSTSVSSSKFNSNLKSYAKISILDWCAVAYAAKKEPISKAAMISSKYNGGEKQVDKNLEQAHLSYIDYW